MPNDSVADVVITMVGTLGVSVASRFVRSLRETGARCSVVMLLPSTATELVHMLAEWHVEAFYYSTTSSPYNTMTGNRQKLVRYLAALQYLERHQSLHSRARVLLADSRDVIFQRDPFTIPADPARPLDIFLEDFFRTYANSGINLGHVVPCFGHKEVSQVLLSPPRPVSCSGVTMGTYDAVARYLRLMWSELRQPRYSSTCLLHDQAFHNWLLYKGRLSPVRPFTNEDGPVTTIGWPEHLYRDKFGRVLNRRGDVVHVVHQFDRRRRLLSTLGKRYALVDKPEPPPSTAAPVDTAAAAFTIGGWPLPSDAAS